jgi:hypothetical protein
MSYLKWKRLCKTCGVRYAEVDNLGVHACKYHCGALNRSGPGKWHPKDCWDCCGKTPYTTLPNGRRNPRFSAKFLNGCTGMDHSAIQTVFTSSDDIPEKQWPRELCEELNDDIMKLRNGDRDIKHKGLKINDIGEFYIERYEKEWYEQRRKHKFDGNEQLTVELFYQYEGTDDIQSIVIEKETTVEELNKKIGATVKLDANNLDGNKKIKELIEKGRIPRVYTALKKTKK